MSSALGQRGGLLALLCQPAEVQGTVHLPPHLRIWGVDSGVRHYVGGSDYAAVRAGAFMGLKIARIAASGSTTPQNPDHTGDGSTSSTMKPQHLVHVSPSEYTNWLQDVLPATITGESFLATYGEHIDPRTVVIPEKE
jgi:hypothetical protein